MNNDIVDKLLRPEEYYPGNFKTARSANALLLGLCTDAANEIERLQAELEASKVNNAAVPVAEVLVGEFDHGPFSFNVTAYGFDHLKDGNYSLYIAPQLSCAEEVIGCFEAAYTEGLAEVLAETTDERLKDLVERRLMYALYAAQNNALPSESIPELRQQVSNLQAELEATQKACEVALSRRDEADQLYLQALAACEAKDAALREVLLYMPFSASTDTQNKEWYAAIALNPNRAALLRHEAGVLRGATEYCKNAETVNWLEDIAEQKIEAAEVLEREGSDESHY